MLENQTDGPKLLRRNLLETFEKKKSIFIRIIIVQGLGSGDMLLIALTKNLSN